jgi:putative ABC transport system ATP-binding protein
MAQEPKPLVRLDQVSKEYPLGELKVQALKQVSLEIRAGEFTALVGRSGSGKSTLLNLIGAIDAPTSGRIHFDGADTLSLSENELCELRNRKIGFVFQGFHLIPVLSVFENIELPLILRKELSAADRREKILRLLEDVELSDFKDSVPGRLSGGQRQRVAIARALVTDPKLIIADEPTANLDSVTTHLIVDLMMRLNRDKGVTFLFSTHDEKLMGRVARTLQIQDGSVQEQA